MKNVTNAVLLAMVGIPQDAPAARAAFHLARCARARLAAAIVRPLPEDMAVMLIGGYTDPALSEITQRLNERFSHDKEAARKIYKECRAQFDDVKSSFETLDGAESEVIARRARFADITVMAHPAGVQRSHYIDVVEATLYRSGRPVLLVPPQTEPEHLLDRVTVLWRNDAESARSLLMTHPILALADRVTVTQVEDNLPDDSDAVQAAGYLAAHSIEASTDRMAASEFHPGRDIYAYAREENSSLITLGAVPPNPFRELVLTSITRHALSHADFPVLMVA